MLARQTVIAASMLLSSAGLALSQTSAPADQPAGSSFIPGYNLPNPSTSRPTRADPFNPNPINPYANAAPHRGIRNPYFGADNPYVTSTATPRRGKGMVNPAEASAQRQSGLTAADARDLLQQQGYTGINDLHADPNSIGVWQADALKDGRRVRVGIDYRGNVLDPGAHPQPCTSPGAGFGGAGPLGTGARISEADRCAGR